MKGSQAQKTVFLAGAAMLAILFAKHPGSVTKPATYKQVWAVGLLTLLLAAAADFAPQVIVPFAVAVVVAFAIRNPGALSGILGAGPASSQKQSGSSAGSSGNPPGVLGPQTVR